MTTPLELNVIEALTHGTPVVIADVCDLLGSEAATVSGKPFSLDDADTIAHDAVDRAPVILLVAELDAWQQVADHLSLEG